VPSNQTWYDLLASGEDYYGECCDTLSNCANAYDSSTSDNVASGWLASTVTFAEVDMAVHACPMKTDVCKVVYRSDSRATEVTNTGGYTIGLEAGTNWTT
jgi:hypothetical protein